MNSGTGDQSFRAQLDYALEAARDGYLVFPCVPNGKVPLVARWEQEATSDPKKISEWWSKWRNANIGAAVGASHLTVLDVDVRDQKAGIASLDLLEEPDSHSLPRTRVVRTPSGGLHIHMAGQTSSKNGFRSGLDVKSSGGYVLMPGSWIDGKPYKWHRHGILQPAPDWFTSQVRSTKPGAIQDIAPANGWDNQADVEWAIDFLSEDAPIAVEGSGGDETTYTTACILRDRGVSVDKAFELMEEFYNPRCQPPWPTGDTEVPGLRTKVENAYRYAQGPAGQTSIAGDFDDAIAENVVRRHRFAELSIEELANVTSPKWLVDGLIPDKGLAVVYGQPKAGKTFWALDLSLSVACAMPFHGVDTRAGRVTYIAAEGGPPRLKDRVQAWMKARELADGSPANWGLVANRVDLTSPKEVEQLVESLGGARDLIVVDTLARCMSGDENSQKDMNAFVEGCDYLREKTRSAVLVVHHEGKDPGKGARGSNVLRGALDAGIRVKRDSDGTIVATVEDQRDGGSNERMYFELRKIPLDGIENTSAALFSRKPSSGVRAEEIFDIAVSMDGRSTKEFADALSDQFKCSPATARRRIAAAIPEGSQLAQEHKSFLIWLERINPANRQSGLIIRARQMSDVEHSAFAEN